MLTLGVSHEIIVIASQTSQADALDWTHSNLHIGSGASNPAAPGVHHCRHEGLEKTSHPQRDWKTYNRNGDDCRHIGTDI